MRKDGAFVRASPFPLESLRSYGAAEAAAMNRAAGLARCVEHAVDVLEGDLDELLGCRVKVSVLPPAGPAGEDAVSGGSEPCAAARIAVPGTEAGLILLVPARFLRRIVARIFSLGKFDPAPDPQVFESMLALTVLEALASIPPDFPAAVLSSVSYLEDASMIPAGRDTVRLDLKVSLESGSDILTLVVEGGRRAELDRMLDETLSTIPPGPNLGACLVPVHMLLGASRVPRERIDRLEPGDVVIPDDMTVRREEMVPASVFLAIVVDARYHKIAKARVEGCTLEVETTFVTPGEKMTYDHDETDAEKTEVSDDGGASPAKVGAIPIEVAVEAGRVQMSVADLSSLAPGRVVRIDRPLSAEVTLTSSGRIIAYGMLVSVEGEMGIQILKVNR